LSKYERCKPDSKNHYELAFMPSVSGFKSWIFNPRHFDQSHLVTTEHKGSDTQAGRQSGITEGVTYTSTSWTLSWDVEVPPNRWFFAGMAQWYCDWMRRWNYAESIPSNFFIFSRLSWEVRF
jgi:hypothetical protein